MSISLKDASNAAVVYSIYRVRDNRAEFIGPAHSDLSKDMVILTSQAPKVTATSYGNRRSNLNVVSTTKVTTPVSSDQVQRDMKLDASASIPNGATLAQFKELTARLSAALADDNLVESFFLTGKIEY